MFSPMNASAGPVSSTSGTAVQVHGLSKVYRSAGSAGSAGVVAVDGVDLTVREAELLLLLGPSGCGKTTLLRPVAGLEVPDRGEVTIGSRLVFSSARREKHWRCSRRAHRVRLCAAEPGRYLADPARPRRGMGADLHLVVGELNAAAILSGPRNPVIGYLILALFDNGTYSQIAALRSIIGVVSGITVSAALLFARPEFGQSAGFAAN